MKTYAFAGASSRAHGMFAKPIVVEFHDVAKIVGVYDINFERAKLFAKDFGMFDAFEDFDNMIIETKPDIVIVTTVDAFHHEFIIKSLEAGCDIITEKPMTIDAKKCKEILEAEKRTGKNVTVTFNYRFNPYTTKIKKILKSKEIGRILSVDFEWILDKNMDVNAHGTSYFRRWNRYMAKSGGLLVHKSTHHFDLVNWWLEDVPVDVFAFGDLKIYGKNGKIRGENCRNCSYAEECGFYTDISKNEFTTEYFTAVESVDGYNKDNCVFAKDIDIYDTMSVNVKYLNGALLTYSLIAHAPYEGWRIAINGINGRIEAEIIESGIQTLGSNTQKIKVFKDDDTINTYEIPWNASGHGGGDRRLQRMLFKNDLKDPLGHLAGTKAGSDSIMIGACANVSIKEKRLVDIQKALI